ncbi:MAG: AAA family ATPase [Planctomycetota bacterium]
MTEPSTLLASLGAVEADPAATVAFTSTSDTTPLNLPPPPPEPVSIAAAGLTDGDVEALVLKSLLHDGAKTGSEIAAHVCLPRRSLTEMLDRLRDELLIAIRGSSGLHDFCYQLTEAGFARARRHAEQCNYSGAAPVPLAAYETAIRRQSIQHAKLKLKQLHKALGDMCLTPSFVSQVAQAVNDGSGMFLYGSPGNGKTTLAERVCDAYGQHIWVPRMIAIGGDLLRLFDPSCHTPATPAVPEGVAYDRRWVLIRRPTVVVGGELTLAHLDANYNPASGVSEAPVQLKANGGALLIDDFGRQQCSSTEILNRLIVPLEKQIDYLHLASGRQIETPFDLLFILSTNLEPRELVDEAFLRRIAYKIEVDDPNEEQFRQLFRALAARMSYSIEGEVLDHLLDEHYRAHGRPLRFCHPRDLLRQVRNYCEVHELPKAVTREAIDIAVANYFAGL